MKASTLGRHLKAGAKQAETHEPALEDAYAWVLRQAGRDAASRFERFTTNHLTADATNPTWTPPDDDLVDAKALAAAARKKTAAAHRKALLAVMGPTLTDIGVRFDLKNPIIGRTFGKLGVRAQDLDAAIRAQVENAVRDGYQEGLSIPNTAANIRAAVDGITGTRATLLARTDMIGLVNGGSVAVAQLAGVAYKRWLTAQDERVRDTHADADGQVVPVDQPFSVGGADLEYPGDPDGPDEEVYNCFPATTSVIAPGLEMGFRRRYEGDLVRVVVMGVGHLSGTPNHPVLTSSGWKPLGLVREGDHLVCAVPRQDEGAVDPDVDDGPAAIHQVFSALAGGEVPRRIRGGAVQFHGDPSADGEVEVVTADGYLRRRDDAAGGEEISEVEFVRAGEAARLLAPTGLGLGLVVGDGASAAGHVRGRGELTALGQGEASHPLPHRVGTAARHDADFAERPVDDGSADAVVLGQRLYGGSCVVSLAEVVAVERDAFHGDVFNLQTESGTYLAGNIIVHNCRCTVTYEEAEDASGTAEDPVALAASSTRPSRGLPSGGHMSDSPSVTEAETLLRELEEAQPLAASVTVTVDEAAADSAVADAVRWRAILCVEGVETQDNALFGRMLAPGSVTWRDLPLSLGSMPQTPHSGTSTANVVGTIDAIYRDETDPSVVWGEGTFNGDALGRETVASIESGSLRGISVDLYVARFDIVPQDGVDVQPGKELMLMTEVVIGAATVVPFQALEDATIAITASADPEHVQILVADAQFSFPVAETEPLDPRVSEALARLELASRREVYETYRVGMDIGLLSLNDCLSAEGMAKVDGGDVRVVPAALAKQREVADRLAQAAELGEQMRAALARVEEHEARTVALVAHLDTLAASIQANQRVNESLVASVREAASTPRTVTFKRDAAGKIIGADES